MAFQGVWSLGLRVPGLGFWVLGWGFRIEGDELPLGLTLEFQVKLPCNAKLSHLVIIHYLLLLTNSN